MVFEVRICNSIKEFSEFIGGGSVWVLGVVQVGGSKIEPEPIPLLVFGLSFSDFSDHLVSGEGVLG